jgi:hypothetical protein
MSRRIVMLLLTACSCFFSQGCTYRVWYGMLQERQRQECYENVGMSAIQKCLDRVDGMTYDEYVKSREDSKRQSQ